MKKAWYDNNHEGKALRYGINKLLKKLKKTEDTEELIKILNCIAFSSNVKSNLAKLEYLTKDIKELKELVKKFLPQKIIGDIAELPNPSRQD